MPRSSFPQFEPTLGYRISFRFRSIDRVGSKRSTPVARHTELHGCQFGRKSRDASADLAWTTDSNEERARTWGREGKKTRDWRNEGKRSVWDEVVWHGWASIERSFRRGAHVAARNPWFTAREDRAACYSPAARSRGDANSCACGTRVY